MIYVAHCTWDASGNDAEHRMNAESFQLACVAARTEYADRYTVVVVMNPDSDERLDVSKRPGDPDAELTPGAWVAKRLAPPPEIAVVSIDQFMNALVAQIQAQPGSTADRPVWIEIDGMLYRPAHIGADSEFGAIMIRPAPEPVALHTKGI